MPWSRLLPALCLAALVLSCATPEEDAGGDPATAALNQTCPVMGGPVDPARTIVVDGRPVAFCCQDCVLEWISMDAEEQQRRLAEVMPGR